MKLIAKNMGFTLIEILASMTVLAIGLVSVASLVMGSMKLGVSVADRNAAAAIIPLAIEDIQRTYLITGNMQFNGTAMTPSAAQIDQILLTVPSLDPTIPSIQQSQFSAFTTNVKVPPTDPTTTSMWPFDIDPPVYYGGPAPPATGGSLDTTSYAYRVIFRLERHPQWTQDTDAFSGIYVLTLAVYRDPTRKATRLDQVSDPVVVYLRDKKVRL